MSLVDTARLWAKLAAEREELDERMSRAEDPIAAAAYAIHKAQGGSFQTTGSWPRITAVTEYKVKFAIIDSYDERWEDSFSLALSDLEDPDAACKRYAAITAAKQRVKNRKEANELRRRAKRLEAE